MDQEYIIFNCPHCKQIVQVLKKEFNCKIFRHGIYKKNLKQIDPHLKKEECDRLKKEDLIFGCGKPFQLIITDNSFEVVVCGYI
jgi:hypothetical protein